MKKIITMLTLLTLASLQYGCDRSGTVPEGATVNEIQREENIGPVEEVEYEEDFSEIEPDGDREYEYHPVDDKLEIEE